MKYENTMNKRNLNKNKKNMYLVLDWDHDQCKKANSVYSHILEPCPIKKSNQSLCRKSTNILVAHNMTCWILSLRNVLNQNKRNLIYRNIKSVLEFEWARTRNWCSNNKLEFFLKIQENEILTIFIQLWLVIFVFSWFFHSFEIFSIFIVDFLFKYSPSPSWFSL